MSKKIRYEWHSLELDEYGDIINIDSHDNFVDALEQAIEMNDKFVDGSVELVKYYLCQYGVDIDGDTRSAWCANNLNISDEFDDGSNVPKYLLKEIQTEVKTWGCDNH